MNIIILSTLNITVKKKDAWISLKTCEPTIIRYTKEQKCTQVDKQNWNTGIPLLYCASFDHTMQILPFFFFTN